ncbi:MAG TPA: DUF305 domain-containing protein [Cellulomonas sp.]
MTRDSPAGEATGPGLDLGPDAGPGPGADVGADVPAGRYGPGRAVLALVVAAALVIGAVLGAVLVRQPAQTVATEGSVDAGFARDMQVHHAQAVQLAVLLRDRSTDEEVRTVALDILLTQQNQIGQLAGWLSTWGLPATSGAAPMAWMTGTEHAHTADAGTATGSDGTTGYAAMPGWVSAADLARLTASEGSDADRLFLQLMIPHHVGGVEMAGYAAEHARRPQVRTLARGIVTAQDRELVALRDMLAARGGPLD